MTWENFDGHSLRPLRWEHIQKKMDNLILSEEELRLKEIDRHFKILTETANKISELYLEIEKVTTKSISSINELSVILNTSIKNYPTPQQQLYRDVKGEFSKGDKDESVKNE